jgi:hypothetical protein
MEIKPDYGLKVSHVYQSFSRELLSAGIFDLLRLIPCQPGTVLPRWNHSWVDFFFSPHAYRLLRLRDRLVIPTCDHGLPSWVAYWTCIALPIAQLCGQHCAGGVSFPKPQFSAMPATVTLCGILLDAVTSLSTFSALDSGYCHHRNSTSKNHVTSAYGDLNARRVASVRTVTGNSTQNGAKEAPEGYSWLLKPRLWRSDVHGVYMDAFTLSVERLAPRYHPRAPTAPPQPRQRPFCLFLSLRVWRCLRCLRACPLLYSVEPSS